MNEKKCSILVNLTATVSLALLVLIFIVFVTAMEHQIFIYDYDMAAPNIQTRVCNILLWINIIVFAGCAVLSAVHAVLALLRRTGIKTVLWRGYPFLLVAGLAALLLI